MTKKDASRLLTLTLTFAVAAAMPTTAQTSAESNDGSTRTPIAHNTWSSGAPMPTAVQYPAVGVIGGQIYVIGGINDTGIVADTQIYNPSTNTWRTEIGKAHV